MYSDAVKKRGALRWIALALLILLAAALLIVWKPGRDLGDESAAAIREAGMEVVLDISAVPHVLGLARLLLEHGFPVSRIYADAFFPEEEEHFDWIRDHAPGIRICSVIHPAMRLYHNTSDRRVLAVGQKAAYFHQTPHFVNMVEGGGLYGYAGILALCRDMEKALLEEKDTADLVVRKGLGCACCL